MPRTAVTLGPNGNPDNLNGLNGLVVIDKIPHRIRNTHWASPALFIFYIPMACY